MSISADNPALQAGPQRATTNMGFQEREQSPAQQAPTQQASSFNPFFPMWTNGVNDSGGVNAGYNAQGNPMAEGGLASLNTGKK
jgi:hypothetical protein